ncbi:MAG: ribulose-5-phosphate 4-epimerase [Homoserinimonas sp.]|jgi:ribulose-5-phosphate 4-epimerase/fuculose-1-phosphate aldolase|nr:ribulose-5-phosphate 4-epimerase [Homoserinimonas sp.]
MTTLQRATRDLIIANRVLANEGVLDAYGHVSIRHPDDPTKFLLSRSLAPEHVDEDDIMEFHLDGTPTSETNKVPYLERFIHGAMYAARPEFNSVVHAHTESVLPFGLTGLPLQAVVHDASDIGLEVPVWDIADKFGDDTNLLVTSQQMAEDLVEKLNGNRVVLMRGHGFAGGGPTISATVRMCVYLARNAHVLTVARTMGQVKPLSAGEIKARNAFDPNSPAMRRAWDSWAQRAGCAHLMAD